MTAWPHGWDVYFTPAFCGGRIQPGFVVRYRSRWYRTKHRVDPEHSDAVLSADDAELIKAKLMRMPYGNSDFHDYLKRTGRKWSDVPLFDVTKLKEPGNG